MADKERILVWAGVATGAAVASAAVYWAGKKFLDDYVPYKVRSTRQQREAQLAWSLPTTAAAAAAGCCTLQYHYRPGTITGWLAQALDRYSQKRRSECPQAPSCNSS